MNLYARHVLPRLIDLAMRRRADAEERARLVPRAAGVVLEAGIGSALNAGFYDPTRVVRVIGVDPSQELLGLGRRRLAAAPVPVRLVRGSAERLPLPDAAVDTVVVTWTLCSIADPARALGEMKRVLRPGGRLLFIEHGRAPDPAVRRWQARLEPVWRRVAGGCHLGRPIAEAIAEAGFRLDELEQGYGDGPRPMAYLYRGVASPAGA